MKFRTNGNIAVGARMKALRAARGLTQAQFGSIAGCARLAIDEAERGRTILRGYHLAGLALYGIDINHLLTGFTADENIARLSSAA